jgi:hypothetical protein
MLNKHENPSDTSKSKRQKQKTKRMYDEHIEHELVETRWGMNNYSSDMDGMCKLDQ